MHLVICLMQILLLLCAGIYCLSRPKHPGWLAGWSGMEQTWLHRLDTSDSRLRLRARQEIQLLAPTLWVAQLASRRTLSNRSEDWRSSPSAHSASRLLMEHHLLRHGWPHL